MVAHEVFPVSSTSGEARGSFSHRLGRPCPCGFGQAVAFACLGRPVEGWAESLFCLFAGLSATQLYFTSHRTRGRFTVCVPCRLPLQPAMSSKPCQQPATSSQSADDQPTARVTRRSGKRCVNESNAVTGVGVCPESRPLSATAMAMHYWPDFTRPLTPHVTTAALLSLSTASAPPGVSSVVGSVATPILCTSAAQPVSHVQGGSTAVSTSSSLPPRDVFDPAADAFAQFRPSSPQLSVSQVSDLSNRDPLLDDRSDVASQYDCSPTDAEHSSDVSSFRDTLVRLHEVCESFAAPNQSQAETPSSFTESALGFLPAAQSKPLALQESAMVSAAVRKAFAASSRSDVVPVSGSLPDFPQALPVGKFLRPKAFELSGNLGLGGLVASSSVPVSTLAVSQEDLLLAASPVPRVVSIPERAVIDNEEIARRALVSCTLADSFLGGLVSAIGIPGSQPFELRQDIDARDVYDFALTLSHVLRFMTSSFARLHLNQILARRDALLASSPSVRDARVRTSLRHVPLSTSSLFSGQVQPLVRRQAEVSRDLAAFAPAEGSAVSRIWSDARPGVSRPPSGQAPPSRPRPSSFRAPSGRTPYSRRPGPARGSSRR